MFLEERLMTLYVQMVLPTQELSLMLQLLHLLQVALTPLDLFLPVP